MNLYYVKFPWDDGRYTLKVYAKNIRAARKEALAINNKVFKANWKRLENYTKVWRWDEN